MKVRFFSAGIIIQLCLRSDYTVRKIIKKVLLIMIIAMSFPATLAFADTAIPSKTEFTMDGKPVSVTAAYSINNTNYLQLRAIAAMLNGTSAQFDIGWDGQYAVIEPGKAYSGTVTATKLQNTTNVRNSGTKFKINGEVFSFSDARLIAGDTNYLQLREFAQKLSGTASQFNVYWDSATSKAVIQPGVASTVTAPQVSVAAKNEKTKTINLDGLLTLEISNSHAYARALGYDPVGATIVHFIIVSDGADIKLAKYVPPYDTAYWQKTEYMISPYNNIYFESGALWPVVTYASEYDDRERGRLGQGESFKAVKGTEYFFSTATDDPAIKSKYGDIGAANYVVRIFTVPADIAAKIGGAKPVLHDTRTTLQEYSVPSGAGSAPVTYIANPNVSLLAKDGWYNLLYDHVNNVVSIEIDAQGNAELRNGNKFYVENKGNNQITLKTEDGKYLGIEGTPVKGARAKALNNQYIWNVYFENNGGFFSNNRYSLRPSNNTGLVLSASGTVKDGTPLMLSQQAGTDATASAEFTFYPIDAPKSEAAKPKSDKLEDSGTYYIKAAKNPEFIFDVTGSSKEDGAKVLIYKNNNTSNQKFKITKVKDNQYTIQSVHAEKWLKSSRTKGAVLTQSGSVTNENEKIFTIKEQADGTYRIMDSKGFYLGISGGKIANGTNIILWTEASDASQTYMFEKIK